MSWPNTSYLAVSNVEVSMLTLNREGWLEKSEFETNSCKGDIFSKFPSVCPLTGHIPKKDKVVRGYL